MTVPSSYPYDLAVSLVLYETAPSEVAACIDQVLASSRRVRLVVIDNSPQPVPLPTYKGQSVEVIHSERNLGYGTAHNRAIATCRGSAPYHLVMNTDVAFVGDVLDEMCAFMDAHPDVGLSSPRILYPDGSLQTSCRLLPSPLNMFGRGFFDKSRWNEAIDRRYELKDWNYEELADIPFLPGCFMLMREDVLKKVKGFDERFFLFAEDLDLSRRIHAVSRSVFVPGSTITHDLRSRAAPSLIRHRYKLVNIARYFAKWGWMFDSERKRINQATIKRLHV